MEQEDIDKFIKKVLIPLQSLGINKSLIVSNKITSSKIYTKIRIVHHSKDTWSACSLDNNIGKTTFNVNKVSLVELLSAIYSYFYNNKFELGSKKLLQCPICSGSGVAMNYIVNPDNNGIGYSICHTCLGKRFIKNK